MSQPGETTNFRASDYISTIHRHAGGELVGYAVLNTRPITAAMKRCYAQQKAVPVENDVETIRRMGVNVMTGNLVWRGDRVRHDPAVAAAVIMKLVQDGRRRRLSPATAA